MLPRRMSPVRVVHRQVLALLAAALFAGCGGCGDSLFPKAGPAKPGTPAAPRAVAQSAVQVRLAYGSEKKSWLEEELAAFEETNPRTASGHAIVVEGRALGSGEAQQAILSGTYQPQVYSPASTAYVSLLNDAWLREPGRTRAVAPGCESVLLSPVVIALWKPMAEALGWPGRPLGWADILRVANDKRGWAAYQHPEWGPFKLGHTHPEYSSSGLLSVLAEAYAGAKKTRGLTTADVEAKATRAFLAQVEQSVVHYGKSTGFFAEKMLERGPAYLSAAVLYENLVVESYGKTPPGTPPLVAVYPMEGTFWTDHPFCILEAPWVSAEQREAAGQLLAFLKARPAQERALALGFRPADTTIPLGAPVDGSHGVDPKQPQTLLEVPDPSTLQALIAVWREIKRGADVTVVLDTSGSMRGNPLEQAKAGAKRFLEALGARDLVSLVFFDSRPYAVVGPLAVGEAKEQLLARIDGVFAKGGTALYDAVTEAYRAQLERARTDPRRIHAVVVLTDGRDENSQGTLPALKTLLSGGEEGGR